MRIQFEEPPARDAWYFPPFTRDNGELLKNSTLTHARCTTLLGVVLGPYFKNNNRILAAWGMTNDAQKYWTNEDGSYHMYEFDTEKEARNFAAVLVKFKAASTEEREESE